MIKIKTKNSIEIDRFYDENFISSLIQNIQELKHDGIKSFTYTYNNNTTDFISCSLCYLKFYK